MEIWHWLSIVSSLSTLVLIIFNMYMKSQFENLKDRIKVNSDSIDRKRKKVDEIEKEIDEVKDNYIYRFDELKELLSEVKIKLVRIEDKVQTQSDFCKLNLDKGAHP